MANPLTQETNKLIKKIYKVSQPYTAKLHTDEDWSHLWKYLDFLGSMPQIKSLDIMGTQYHRATDGEGGYKEYKIRMVTEFDTIIDGVINCNAAGSMENPFGRYDITISLWRGNDNNVMENTEQKSNIDKGIVLMRHALEKYESGDIESADKDREMANHFFDKKDEVEDIMAMDDVLYTENRNFGIIYHVLTENFKQLYFKQDKKKMKKIIESIQKNPVLLNEFKFYNTLVKTANVLHPSEFINEMKNLNNKFSKDDYVKANQELINTMRDINLNEAVDIDNDTMKLYEAIEFVLLNEKSMKNLNNYVNAMEVIKENLISNDVNDTASLSYEDIIESSTKELEEKFDNVLNEDEKKWIETYSVMENKEEVFENYKKNVLSKIESIITESDNDSKKSWMRIQEHISNKMFDDNNFLVDMVELTEIDNTI